MKMNRSLGGNNIPESTSAAEKSGVVFFLFCLWSVVGLCRPQDIIPALVPLRPAMVISVLTLIFFFLKYNRKNLIILKDKQVRYFFLLVLLMILGLPTSLHSGESFEFVFYKYMKIVIYFVMFALIVDSVEKISRVLFLACIGSAIYLGYTVMSDTSFSGRLRFSEAQMFDPNDLAFFALCFIPLNLIFISKDNKLLVRVLCLTGFLLSILSVFLTGSRGGMLGLGIAFSAILFRETVSVRKRFKIFAVITGVLVLSLWSIDTDRLMTIFTLEEDYNTTSETGRLALWGRGVTAMLENPLTGVGVGRFSQMSGKAMKSDGGKEVWKAAHNSVVEIGAETGVFGLTLFLMLSWNAVKIFARTSREATSTKLKKVGEMGLAGFLGMFTAAFFLSQAYSFYWAFYIVFSVVVFKLLSNELAFEGKKLKL